MLISKHIKECATRNHTGNNNNNKSPYAGHFPFKAENKDKRGGTFLLRPHHGLWGYSLAPCISFPCPRQLETPRGHDTQNRTALCLLDDAGTWCSLPERRSQDRAHPTEHHFISQVALFFAEGKGFSAMSRYTCSPCRKSLSPFFYNLELVSLRYGSSAIHCDPYSSTCCKIGNQTQEKYAMKIKHLKFRRWEGSD